MPNTTAHTPELLAPAGGWEQLRYALHFGADAVYLSCDRFGLRARAANFSLEDLPAAVALAHESGARVYVTCNAYAHDEDLDALPEYARAMEAAGVDAAIVSDLGVMAVVQEHAPSLAIHVSTQASVSNAAAAMMWYRLGARRVVCAREMSVAEIAAMGQAIPADMEIEVFVHGAMCMAVSGRCLISDYLAGRHANKGHCVQPCRWEYKLTELSRPDEEFGIEEDEAGTYLLNSKDLNMLSHLDDLAAAGVSSVKIEGRVKKAFYVATVVNAYRHVLDGENPAFWEPELNTISHRPYSTGFYYGPAEQSVHDDVYTQLYDWVAEVVESAPAAVSATPAAPAAPATTAPAVPAASIVSAASTAAATPAGPNQAADASITPAWRVKVLCRNRFFEGDELEVLSPHMPVQPIQVQALAEVFADGTEVPAEKASKAMGAYVFTCSIPLKEHDILRVRRKDPSRKN